MENKDRYQRPYAIMWIVSGFIVFIGYVLHIVGFATNYWIDVRSFANSGLWRICTDNKECVDLPILGTDWLRAVQALTIIGIILGFIALMIISLIDYFLRQYVHVWRIAACTCSVLAGLSVITAIAVYGGIASTSRHLHYSFGLSAAGGSLMLIGGIVLCVDNVINRGYRRQPKVRNVQQAKLYLSSFPQELRALPYDGYKIPYPAMEPPRVYEGYPGNAYEVKKIDEPYLYDTWNYGTYDQGPIKYVAYKQDHGRKAGRYDYY